MANKYCYKCGKTKDVLFFHKNRSKKDGFSSSCKTCCAEYDKKYTKTVNGKAVKKKARLKYHKTKKGKEKRNELAKKYQKTDKGKVALRKNSKRQSLINPCRTHAIRVLNTAIRNGEISRGVCEIDGCSVMGQGHHNHYSKPLEVRWLCHQHHMEHHYNLREQNV